MKDYLVTRLIVVSVQTKVRAADEEHAEKLALERSVVEFSNQVGLEEPTLWTRQSSLTCEPIGDLEVTPC